jgi:asparagine synthase (glutamine-hydrolysing)
MTPVEIAWGYVFGHDRAPVESSERQVSLRQAVEEVVCRSLLRPPCGVAFSGGRDSSLILALATHVARREGLPEPIAITKVFPDVPDAEESEWQNLVVRHLGVREWERIDIREELDVLGPLAADRLTQHGVVWPVTTHADIPMLDLIKGGSLIDGEGGDDVLGVEPHRIAPLNVLFRSSRRPSRSLVRASLRALAPPRVRSARLARHFDYESASPWLRPEANREFLAAVARKEREQPLRFSSSVRLVTQRRVYTEGLRTRRFFARRWDVEYEAPLLHPDVVDACAREGGWLGRGTRTATLRALVPDLLPDAVLSRTSKAAFNDVYWSRHAQHFADQWTGDGIDRELVDVDQLRDLWRSDGHKVRTKPLLQQAWLASTGSS